MTGEQLSTVISSGYRQAVITELQSGPATPSTIAENTDKEIAHVSRALTDLRNADLVELIVPESQKKGRLYDLTQDGKELLDEHSETIARNGE